MMVYGIVSTVINAPTGLLYDVKIAVKNPLIIREVDMIIGGGSERLQFL
jgi:hypothetical protein